MTNWNGTTISYDLNGNMLSDGTNTFTWNARDQVASLNGRTLQYDAYGRRIQNQLGTAFLYDGANAAQELTGGTAAANLLSGGVDVMFSRTDSSGSFTPLTDALGNTIALLDASGTLSTQYTYDPFGNTTLSGAVSSNPSQYTERENDGNGLYFYRARYYSSPFGRFITEDPLRLGSGDVNFYAYVGDSPTNYRDSTGLSRECPVPRLCDSKTSPPVRRAPDYYVVSGSFTGPGVQVGSSVTIDRYGRVYVTPVNGGIWFPRGPGGSVTAGWLDPLAGRKPPDPDTLANFINGLGRRMRTNLRLADFGAAEHASRSN